MCDTTSSALDEMQVERVSVSVPFARITGVDLRHVSADVDGATLRRLMETHAVLIFPAQTLVPQDELRINRAFGYHDEEQAHFNFGFTSTNAANVAHDGSIPSCPAVQLQGNVLVNDHFGINELQLRMVLGLKEEGFHSDAVHDQADFERRDMPVLTSMYCIQAPDEGGETHFACTRAAWARVRSEERRTLLRRLRVHYQNGETIRLRGQPIMHAADSRTVGVRRFARERDASLYADGHMDLDGQHSARGGPVHPLIRVHTGTGEEAVFLSCGNVAFMEAPAAAATPSTTCGGATHAGTGRRSDAGAVFLSCEESYDLIEELLSEVCSPPRAYEHQWQKRDFVIWDNRICLHSAPRLEGIVGGRLFHRVRLRGSQASHADCTALWDEVLRGREAEGPPEAPTSISLT